MHSRIFQKLEKISSARRQVLPFVKSLEDHDIVIAIGDGYEQGRPLGRKQLTLLNLAPPSTLQRRLDRLIRARVVRKFVQNSDGRCVAYTLTRQTMDAYRKFARLAGLHP